MEISDCKKEKSMLLNLTIALLGYATIYSDIILRYTLEETSPGRPPNVKSRRSFSPEECIFKTKKSLKNNFRESCVP